MSKFSSKIHSLEVLSFTKSFFGRSCALEIKRSAPAPDVAEGAGAPRISNAGYAKFYWFSLTIMRIMPMSCIFTASSVHQVDDDDYDDYYC